ncbi:MAG: MGMT family protein [Verrucomicrobiales bacterium]|nr:MGMT family protein [Verrucomicrobiales bacterium]
MNEPARKITAFEARVYEALCRIPRGKVMTYAGLGKAIGCGSAQAVGQALKRNPHAPEVPCHRVIRTDLTLGGYSGETEGAKLDQKRALLAEEGVRFDKEGGLIDVECVWSGSEV